MHRISVEEFREAEKMPLIVVLDDVRSMYNIGSVFRTCDAFRVEAIYLCGITACPPHQEIHKTALGAEDSVRWRYFKKAQEAVAEDSVRWRYFKTAQEAVEQLHQDGYFVWSVEQCEGSVKAPTPLQLPRGGGSEGVAVILGNEVKGVHQEVIDMSDGCLEIPQFGTKHSMNVSVTAGIVIWEFVRQYMF